MRFSIFLVIAIAVFCSTLLLQSNQCAADIVKYQDASGKIYFTSDRDSIPAGAKVLKVYKTDQGTRDEPEEERLEKQHPQSSPKKSSPRDGIIVRVLQDMVKEYHATHTYSKSDFYVCADMTLDVWNMIETKGINARIAVGNVQNPHAKWDQFNHAWVMAEVASDSWLALETTGGTIVRGDANRKYYRGLFFETPREFKEYVELRRERRDFSSRIKDFNKDLEKVKAEYQKALQKHNDLTKEYNKKYADKRLSRSRFKKSMKLRDQLNDQAMVVKELEGRGQQLVGIINSNVEEVRAIDQQLDRPIERLNAN